MTTMDEGDKLAGEVSVAPRVTLEQIEALVASESYSVHNMVLTVCVLTLTNGFMVVGESACASPENFNAVLGQKFAREHAIRQIWRLEGYALRDRLHRGVAA